MDRILKQFNWRFLLVRFLVNAIAVAITAAVTPKIYFVDRSIVSWVLITVMLGVINALLKPILQFLTLQFIFVTYGLVIVLVNTLILLQVVASAFFEPARSAAPWATASSADTEASGSIPDSRNSIAVTWGIRVDPPTRMIRSISIQVKSESATSLRTVNRVRSSRCAVISSNSSLLNIPPFLRILSGNPTFRISCKGADLYK